MAPAVLCAKKTVYVSPEEIGLSAAACYSIKQVSCHVKIRPPEQLSDILTATYIVFSFSSAPISHPAPSHVFLHVVKNHTTAAAVSTAGPVPISRKPGLNDCRGCRRGREDVC